ncbi:MAG: amidohydrolase family protein [Acidobacteriota bacterium]
MKGKISIKFIGLLCFLLILINYVYSEGNKGYAIVNAYIFPVTSAPIENGILLIKDDKIEAIGKDLEVPEGYEIINAKGLYVYPGLIDSSSFLGLSEIGSVRATVDTFEIGNFKPHIKAEVAINPHSELIPVTRVNGIATVLVSPRGGTIAGQSALVNLIGWTPEEMVLKSPAAIHISYPRVIERRRFGAPGEKPQDEAVAQKQLKELKEFLDRTKRYIEIWEAYNKDKKGSIPEKDLILEAMAPALKGEIPVVISADKVKEIKGAIELADGYKMKLILSGASEGWKCAKFIGEKGVPVILSSLFSLPGEKEPYDAIYANASILNKAGVKVVFSTESASDVRNLPYQAGTASAYGLPKEEALKGITIYPAEIFGVQDKIGSLEKGKIANIILTDGDPLEMRTQTKHLFIKGQKLPLTSKHIELYEKFRKRPSIKFFSR